MLNQTDFSNIIRIIDVAAEKGMFKGQELSAVGQLRDKCVASYDAATKQPKEEMVINTSAEKESAE